MGKECTFCDRVLIETQKLYETRTNYVIYSIRDSNKGRCLVIPKRHLSAISEMTEKEARSFFETIRHVSIKLKSYLHPQGINYGLNEGAVAGQTKEHLHFHIIPRYTNDPLPEFHLFHGNPNIKKNLSPEEFNSLTLEFRDAFSKKV